MTSRGKQGGFQDWQQLRTHAITLFGEPPHPATEQDIIDAYEQHPDAIAKAVDRIAHDVASGSARSGWGVLRARANTIQHAPSNPTRATGVTREKTIARAEQWIRNAGCHYDRETEVQDELFGDRGLLREYAQYDRSPDERLVRTPSVHTAVRNPRRTTPSDSLTTLADNDAHSDEPKREHLRSLDSLNTQHLTTRGDTALVNRLTEAWRTARPAGERVEQELDERGRRWIEHQAKLRELAAQKAAELETAAQARERITDEAAAGSTAAPVNAVTAATAPDLTNDEIPF